ncbi:hypothetical protein ACFORH_43505 [Amycolatopsis roodepoortensis]|uniref:Antitoxin (DNA-binding transcriptional repressor) of toxin-antitoxin stability system n=1 Tax=Amycolatopsis roodepoortensis TaxID=700274 RepID=A0ABR9LIA4_9PSEU|nr:hypothetical protein [Amycolatopsis roodepoortensis]MBE1580388.1 antitoxin (DNA-binding transcriptional repressor) of toxin-antitoxin stability system [Amycolatopsis roodepoortensis]
MDMSTVQRTPGKLRRAVRQGHTVPLTFRDIPFAGVVPLAVLDQLIELAGDKGRALISDYSEEAVA